LDLFLEKAPSQRKARKKHGKNSQIEEIFSRVSIVSSGMEELKEG